MTLVELMDLTRKLAPEVDVFVYDKNNKLLIKYKHDKGYMGNTFSSANPKVIKTLFDGLDLGVKIDYLKEDL
jgi:hypothetical protein